MDTRTLVQEMVKHLVDEPDLVFVRQVEGTVSTVLEVEVAQDDVGKIIGKRGGMADAFRYILSGIGGKEKHRYILEIIEG